MLKISLKAVNGYSDVSVSGRNISSNPELNWVSDQVSPTRRSRNVCFLPICIENPLEDGITYLGPVVIDDDLLPRDQKKFITSPVYPGPILKDSCLVSIMDANDNVIRDHLCTPPLTGLIKNGRVQIDPGEVLYTSANMGLFDKTEIPNSVPPLGREYWLLIEFDFMGLISGAYCNMVTKVRFGSSQMRHGEATDIP